MTNNETQASEPRDPPQSWGEAYARQQEEIEELRARIADLEGRGAPRTRPTGETTEKPPSEKRSKRKG